MQKIFLNLVHKQCHKSRYEQGFEFYDIKLTCVHECAVVERIDTHVLVEAITCWAAWTPLEFGGASNLRQSKYSVQDNLRFDDYAPAQSFVSWKENTTCLEAAFRFQRRSQSRELVIVQSLQDRVSYWLQFGTFLRRKILAARENEVILEWGQFAYQSQQLEHISWTFVLSDYIQPIWKICVA